MNEKPIIINKKGSERGFALVFGIVFLVIAFYPLINDGSIRIWGIIISIAFLIIGILKPILLKMPNLIWIKFGLFLGSIVSPIVMGFIYILAIIPTGLIVKIFRRDPLNQNLHTQQKSFWIKRKDKLQSFKNQF